MSSNKIPQNSLPLPPCLPACHRESAAQGQPGQLYTWAAAGDVAYSQADKSGQGSSGPLRPHLPVPCARWEASDHPPTSSNKLPSFLLYSVGDQCRPGLGTGTLYLVPLPLLIPQHRPWLWSSSFSPGPAARLRLLEVQDSGHGPDTCAGCILG